MKKKIFQLKNFANVETAISKVKKAVKNELSDDAAELRKSIIEMLDELAETDVEVDEAELAAKVTEMIKAYNGDEGNDVPASVANAIAAKFAAMTSKMPVSDRMTPKIKNEVAAAILRASDRQGAIEAANAVAVKNGISGLTFTDVVDYAINDNWGASDELFNALKKTRYSKFFYTSQDFDASGVRAHGWDKTSENEKTIQQIIANGKTITTQYVYKRQQIALEDLDDIQEQGEAANFLRWLNDELDRQIVNSVVAVILGSANFSDITTFESLFGSNATDAFRTAVTVTDADEVTIEEARSICDAVKNPNGKAKWAVMNTTQLTKLAAFVYASGGSTVYHSKEEVAGMLGVDRIYVTDMAATVICFIPDGYWVKEKNALSVSYPKYENNVMNYQKERNMGGGIHDLKSVAFGKE